MSGRPAVAAITPLVVLVAATARTAPKDTPAPLRSSAAPLPAYQPETRMVDVGGTTFASPGR